MFFSGTSTGKLYETGKVYETGAGERYRANPDGSFTNLRSQVTLKGSSRDPRTKWYRGSSKSSSRARHIPAAGSGAGSETVSRGPARASSGGTGSGSSVVMSKPELSGGTLTLGSPLAPKDMPLYRTGSGTPEEAAGAISDIGWAHTFNGAYVAVPSNDMKQRMEDDIFQEGMWFVRNKLLPDLMLRPQPFPSFLDREKYGWSFLDGGWKPRANEKRVPPSSMPNGVTANPAPDWLDMTKSPRRSKR